MKRLARLYFLLIAVLLLAPWPVAYAYEDGGRERVEIRPAGNSGWQVYGGAVGGINAPIDLFYIDATRDAADNHFALYLTNADALAHAYRYLILKVGVYVQSNGEWARVSSNGLPPNIFITLLNGQASFTLPGAASYKISIDGGSFYCFDAAGDQGKFSPQFYLEVN